MSFRGLLLALFVAGAWAVDARAAGIPNPAVEGPIEGGTFDRPFNHALEPLEGKGFAYTEREFFYGGTATNLASGATADYRSRMVVRLPKDPDDFSGRVYVEWANVTSNYDLESRWPSAGGEFHMRRGNGTVVVSAQLVGVLGLLTWDLDRYGSLNHPGDDFSYDIFAQAIEALRDPAGGSGADPMSGLRARKLVAAGTSQSAIRLTTFINDGYTRDRVDLFALTRGGGPYDDFSTPIVNVNEENNEIPQPDNPSFVGWEEAGSAHAPQRFMDYATALSDRDLAVSPPLALLADACAPINQGTIQYTTRAMTHWIDRYLDTGRMPPTAPRVQRTEGGQIVRDENGLAEGGVRQPFVEVPTAFNTGEQCPLFGRSQPWSDEKIRSLYASHCEYATRVRRWADRAIGLGWLLPEDRDEAVREAGTLSGPWGGDRLTGCAPAGLRPGPVRLVRRRGGVLVRGRAPIGTRLRVRLRRGAKVVSRGRKTAGGSGRFRARMKVRRVGRYRATVVTEAGERARSNRLRLR